MTLKPYKIPLLKTYKKGTSKIIGVNKIKWFAEPMRTIFVQRHGDYQKIKYEAFNPGSRHHIIKWLKEDYNYTFPYYTAAGNIKADADSLDDMKEAGGELLVRYLKVAKDQSQVGEEGGGWLASYNEATHSIHHRVDLLGATTHRATHCVPLTTKALTKTGWKTYDELVVGEEVLGYDMQTGTKKWTKLKAVHVFKDAEVGSIGNTSQRIRCTADHKFVGGSRHLAEYKKKGNYLSKLKLIKASELNANTAILVNAPYDNPNDATPVQYTLPLKKYEYNHLSDVLTFNTNQLHSYLFGFLLADGHLKKSTNGVNDSWRFSQVKGHILETTQTALYLYSDKRITAGYKNRGHPENHQDSYTVTQTNNSTMTGNFQYFKQWEVESIEDVWCPETELGTWVMKQEDNFILISSNSSPNLAQVPADHRYRALFCAPPGRVMVGADLKNIEIRVLAHYLAKYDNGKYADAVLSRDMHWYHSKLAGFWTKDDRDWDETTATPEMVKARKASKAFFFG